jgi:hypothetical protein
MNFTPLFPCTRPTVSRVDFGLLTPVGTKSPSDISLETIGADRLAVNREATRIDRIVASFATMALSTGHEIGLFDDRSACSQKSENSELTKVAGGSFDIVQRIAGHSELATTIIYDRSHDRLLCSHITIFTQKKSDDEHALRCFLSDFF